VRNVKKGKGLKGLNGEALMMDEQISLSDLTF